MKEMISNKSRISKGAVIREGAVIGKGAVIPVCTYKYYSNPVPDEKADDKIRLGCFTRTVEEWEEDWNNNDNEFSTEELEVRRAAYNFNKEWLRIYREYHPKGGKSVDLENSFVY